MLKHICTVLVALTMLTLHIKPAVAETITLVADEWAPFNIQPNKQPEGYMIDIAREVFKAHGIEVEYRLVPWKRALEGTRKGEYTAAIGAAKSNRTDLIFPKEELVRNRLSFWVKKGNSWNFTNRDSVKSVSLGLIEDYDYRQWLNAYTKTNRNNSKKIQFVSGTKGLETNIKKLIAGRIDVLVDNEAVVRYTAKQLGLLDDIALAGHDTETAYGYIAFSSRNPRSNEYAAMLSEGIVKMRKNGRLEQLLSVYGLKDWKER